MSKGKEAERWKHWQEHYAKLSEEDKEQEKHATRLSEHYVRMADELSERVEYYKERAEFYKERAELSKELSEHYAKVVDKEESDDA